MAKPGTMSHWCEMPAPNWARKLAAEAIRERDCEPSVLFPPTPRGEDGSLDDLLYWLRGAERFLEAVKVGWIGKQDWLHWCKILTGCAGAKSFDPFRSSMLTSGLCSPRL